MSIEIRPIQPGEVETFLSLLCKVFELDVDKARPVFLGEPTFDLQRKWALWDRGEMVSILTTTRLDFADHAGIGIAGVATDPSRRGEGLAGKLLDVVCENAATEGEGAAYLFAQFPTLYAHHGFEIVDEVWRGPIRVELQDLDPEPLASHDVETRYDLFAKEHPHLLVRSQMRWDLWNYRLKVADPVGERGYLVVEGDYVREAILPAGLDRWPSAHKLEWYGLGSMTRLLGVPGDLKRDGLFLMSRNAPYVPLMFMTDQF